jgi:hypothetical protein
MITEPWEPTSLLEWTGKGKSRVLRQRWRRKCIEYREYNGNPTPRRCEWYENEWRIIPSQADGSVEHE